jgi:AcrR family transcriptional regulator
MARPSNNIDQRLLDSGLALLPLTGCRGLSARRLAEHAQVNLGMFHYHFRSKDNFIRILLGRLYEQMFSVLVIKAAESKSPLQNLRNALQVLGHFGTSNQRLLVRIAADAIAGEPVAMEFLRANVPRHVGMLASLIAAAQKAGKIEAAPLPQILAFLGGSVITPVLVGSALIELAGLDPAIQTALQQHVLSEQGLHQRIEFALRGLSTDHGKTT